MNIFMEQLMKWKYIMSGLVMKMLKSYIVNMDAKDLDAKVDKFMINWFYVLHFLIQEQKTIVKV